MSENQKDLVLSPNEYAYLLDETKGNVNCNVGPYKMSLSQSDRMVAFDPETGRFVPCDSYSKAIKLFTTVPEGWYVALKNPTSDGRHPTPGTSNSIPENMKKGCKVNIRGPVSFALYPGQMAKVIKGHTLHTNQYLVARVYDAETLNSTKQERVDHTEAPYVDGQILIIKGTEIPFYIPPTGIEVKLIDSNPNKGYVRDAVTLEQLEYCILKDESGNKRYVYGPKVVFPSPTESFIKDEEGQIKRRAIELSEISGVYVKVISDYEDAETKKKYKIGDELFITGKDQMIYYPRQEHTFITYNGKIVHHAIAIPKGEGRYVLNRMTGEIKTITGPTMYLPDPRYEVVVKRKLTKAQCDLWYPNNQEVLAANGHYEIPQFPPAGRRNLISNGMNEVTCSYATNTFTTAESFQSIDRSETYTPPRTISFDSSKYEGAVSINVWTGYAVNVISKDGTRNVVCGPRAIVMDYDQTLETLELSTGKPKVEDRLQKVAFLRYENNKVSDIIDVQTSDFANAQIKVSYTINFDKKQMDKWFNVDNYVKYLCEWGRSAIKKEVRQYPITELYNGLTEIVMSALVDAEEHDNSYIHEFAENGMQLTTVEILSLTAEEHIQQLIDIHQGKAVSLALNRNAKQQAIESETEILKLECQKEDVEAQCERFAAKSKTETQVALIAFGAERQKVVDAEEKRKLEAQKELQALKDELFNAQQEQQRITREAEIAYQRELAAIKSESEAKAAEAIKSVIAAIGPELASAINAEGNRETLTAIAESISPYSLAKNESVSTTITQLLRGTGLEQFAEALKQRKS